MSRDVSTLQDVIEYHFRVPFHLQHALTHRSHSQESPEEKPHNERLEFLGDAVLGFVVSERLIDRFPSYPEGKLTKIKAYLVSSANLVKVAQELDLGAYLHLGRGEELSGGRMKKALLVNTLEALIAAIYLDGGMEGAAHFVDRVILTADAVAAADVNFEADNYKSVLQELLQGEKLPAPAYRIAQEAGPPHQRTFTIELVVGELFRTWAKGSTKKAAEQEAARLALGHFRKGLEAAPAGSASSKCNATPSPPVE
jgi:ribonuclease-3